MLALARRLHIQPRAPFLPFVRSLMIDVSPPAVPRGVLIPDAFRKVIRLQAAVVHPTSVAEILASSVARRVLLQMRKTRTVSPNIDDDSTKLVVLAARDLDELDQEGLDFVKEHALRIVPFSIELTYDYWNADQVLAAVLPEDVPPPSAFTQMGHVAHLNLRPQHLPYKHLIGEVLLSKCPNIRTVVNKTNNIHAKYRFFAMELLAGEPDYIVTMSETGCTFRFDFRKVYYNGRLSTEHARLVDSLAPTAVVADVFGGVGPFAIPAAKKGCAVMLNDLNPESVKWAGENIVLNEVQELVRLSQMDGVDFIRESAVGAWLRPFPAFRTPMTARQKARQARNHAFILSRKPSRTLRRPSTAGPENTRRAPTDYVMNLPSTAVLFLFAFRGLLRPIMDHPEFREVYGEDGRGMPMIHLYCFARKLENEKLQLQEIVHQASASLSCTLDPTSPDIYLHWVRSVAPAKDMWCLSFRLPWEVATAEMSEEELAEKKAELDKAHSGDDD